MPKYIHTILLTLLLFGSIFSFAQKSYEDSTLAIINQSKDLKEKVFLYRQLSERVLNKKTEQAIIYSRKAVEHAKRGNYKIDIAASYLSILNAYRYIGKIDEGILLADTLISFAKNNNLYKYHFFAEDLLSDFKRRKADYNSSLIHSIKCIKIAEENNDDTLIASGYNSIAILYLNLQDRERSEEYHLKALALYQKLKLPRSISRSYNNLGIVYREKGDYNTSLSYYHKALNIAISEKDTPSISFLYNDIGAAYSKNGDVVNGEKYLKTSIALREKSNELYELAYTYNYLGENYERKKDLINAELNIKKALAIAIQIGNNKQHYQALESLSEFYSRNAMYDSAYSYLRSYHSYRDSLAHLNNNRVISELTTKYETKKKEQKIILQKASIDKKNYVILAISLILIIGLLLSYTYYRRYKQKQQERLHKTIIDQQELATKAVIEAEEKERKRIAGDLHDGIGQIMSAARMNLYAIKSDLQLANTDQESAFDKALSLVDEGCKEVRIVSHNIMPNALLKAGLVSAIREFVDKIDHRVLEVTLYSDGLKERLPSNIETVLYRVIQECVNNVIKHAAANKLDITLIHDNDNISVTIEDNGKGFDTKNVGNSDGIGLKNMQSRINYLKGTIEWDSTEGTGTVVMIHIPSEEMGS